jgi:hypothetical protein
MERDEGRRTDRTFERSAAGARVVLRGYEEGCADIARLRERPIKLDANPDWWNGPHEASEAEADEVAVDIVRIDRDPEA